MPSHAAIPGWWILLALTVLGFLVQSLRLAWFRTAPRRAMRRAARQGQEGETRAEQVLRALGYRVLARQVQQESELQLDGKTEKYQVRADLWVERDGRNYIAEVKTGRAAALQCRATRRQLLEYCVVFGVSSVLLVHPDSEAVQEVGFQQLVDEREEQAPKHWGALVVWSGLVGVGAGALLMHLLPTLLGTAARP